MTRGKYANAAKARRIDELEEKLVEAKNRIAELKNQLATSHQEYNLLTGKDASTRMAEAARLAAHDITTLNQRHQRETAQLHEDTRALLAYLVDVVAEANRGALGAGQTPSDLPGLLHHFAQNPGACFAHAVNAAGSDDPDIAVMANRRNRRADINDYVTESAHRRERGLEVDDALIDRDAWRTRAQRVAPVIGDRVQPDRSDHPRRSS